MTEDKQEVEWSHLVDAGEITAEPQTITIEPTEAQRMQLVRRLGLLALDECRAMLKLMRDSSSLIHITGQVQAHVRQSCVITLEPVDNDIAEPVEGWFTDPAQAISLAKARHDQKIKKGHGEMPVPDERDDPEPIIDGKIDVGELVTQHLALGIDLYPRAPGVEIPEGEELRTVHEDPSAIKNPFAALKDWKKGLK